MNYGPSVSPYYQDMSSWSVAKLIREIEEKKRYIESLRSPGAGTEDHTQGYADLYALETELERR